MPEEIDLNEIMIYRDIKTRESRCVVLAIFLLSIYSFWGYLFSKNVPYCLLVASIIIIIFSLIIKKNVVITHCQLVLGLLILLFILTQLLLAGYSLFPGTSIKTAINRSALLFIGMLIYIQGNWYKNGIKFLFVFSCVHVFFTVIAYLLPGFFYNVVLPVFPNQLTFVVSQFMSKGVYPGITDQIARNAFYITVGISIQYGNLLAYSGKQSKFKHILLLIFLLSLLLTGKRGHLVANLITMIFVYGTYARFKGKSFLLRVSKITFILFFVFIILINVFPESAAPFTRFLERQGGDQTSGRLFLYINAIELFKQKPILGWGAGVFSSLFGKGNHNLYLQLLSENGLVGFLLFFSLLAINFFNTLKAIKINILSGNNDENGMLLLFSLYIQLFYMIYGMTGNPLNDGFILIIYLLASSIPCTLNFKKKSLRVSSFDLLNK